MMNKIYPKVLIINRQSILKTNATGITLRSMWSEWPLERIMEIYLDEYESHVQYREDFHSVCIPGNVVEKIAHGSRAQRINSEIKHENNLQSKSIKAKLRQFLVLSMDALPVHIDKSIYNKIEEFQPEIIYTLGASVSTLSIVSKMSKYYNIPILIHFMDNWAEHLQWEDNKLITIYRWQLMKELRKCLKNCKKGLSISPQMAETYNRIYSIPFNAIMNCVDVSDYHHPPKSLGDPIIFAYAGGLHLNRWKALSEISKAIDDVGLNAELRIYTSKDGAIAYKEYFKENTFFCDPVKHEDISKIYSDADILVHAEVDSPQLTGFFKYSISTKIPEYLSSGRVMLFYGPKTMGLYYYLSNSQSAYVASSYDELCQSLLDISTGKHYDQILTNANKLAMSCHDAKHVREELRETIVSCTIQ